MAFAYFDRVKESSTTTGLGVFTLGGAVSGFQAFSANYSNGDTLHYVIYQAATGAWEVGFGTWLTGNQLQRTQVLASSNANALVNFTSGTKEVFVAEPAGVPSMQGARFFSKANAAARDAIPASILQNGALCRLIDSGLFYVWNGTTWLQFRGFMPTVGAAGTTIVSNGTDWVAGALDLSDPDSHTGILTAPYGGTGISGAGGTANRVLLTTDGTSWIAGLVTAAMISGTIPFSSLPNGDARSVLGRSGGTAGPVASIDATVDGQTLRRSGGVLDFGALDLADPDAVTGLLPGTNVDPLFGTRNVSTTGTASFGKTTVTPLAEVGGSPYALRVTGSLNTGLAAGTEAPDIDLNLARAVQFSTGSLAAQRSVKITAATYSFVAASTLADAATVAISGPPIAGTNATITRSMALWVESGRARFDGGVSFGAATASTGDVRVGSSWTIYGPVPALADQQILSYNQAGTPRISLGSDGTATNTALWLDPNLARMRVGSNTYLQLTTTVLSLSTPTLQFEQASSIRITTAAGSGASGATMTYTAQDASGSSGTAGQSIFRGGDASGPSGTGGPALFRGGDATGPSGTRVGGPATLRSGTGANGDGDMLIQRGAVPLIQLVKPVSVVLGLMSAVAVTTTHMPANTGDRVAYVADAAIAPTSGFSTLGGILFSESSLGLEWKGKNGVETTIAPHGDTGNTTKRRFVEWKTQPKVTAVSNNLDFTAASFDVAGFNGQSLSNGVLKVKAHFTAVSNSPTGYSIVEERMAAVVVVAGVVTVSTAPDVAFSGMTGSPLGTATIDNSGTVVRLQLSLTSGAGLTSMTVFAYFEVTGFET